jgi:predicted ATPase
MTVKMRESIEIRNLGPIKGVSLPEIKPLTVFIGESGSGKSTLMKTISLFRWVYKMQNIRSYLKNSKVSKSPFRFRMDTYFRDSGLDEFVSNQTFIQYTVHFEEGKSYTITFANNKLSGTNSKDLISPNHLFYNKISFISENRNIIPLWANRGASLAGAFLGFYFHEVFRDFESASEKIRDLPIKYLGLKLSVKKVQSSKKYFISDLKGDYEIEFKNSSSGTQNATPVTLISEHFSKHFDFEDAFNRTLVGYLSKTDKLTDFKPVKNLSDIQKLMFIHVEEPELSLFPDAQCQMISELIRSCFVDNSNEVRLMFSTHSPYIINHLNLLLRAFDTKSKIDGAAVDFNKVEVFLVEDGGLSNLMIQEQRLVNTNRLSDTINDIYDEFAKLK